MGGEGQGRKNRRREGVESGMGGEEITGEGEEEENDNRIRKKGEWSLQRK